MKTIFARIVNGYGRDIKLWHGNDAPATGLSKKGDLWANTAEYDSVPHVYNGTAWPARGVWAFGYDSAAYFTITQADTGGVTFNSVSDGTASFTFSDPLVLGHGRFSTSTVAGANIELGASYTYGEVWEHRYRVTDWTGIGNSFKAFYFRAENGVAGSNKGLRTAEFYAADYDFGIGNIQVIYADLLLKGGDTAVAYGGGNAIEACISPEGGAGAITVTDYLAGVRINVSSNNRFDATNAAKLHGLYILARDGDGGSPVLGHGIYIGNDSAQAGTRTFTNGIYINIGCATAGINLSGCTGACSNILLGGYGRISTGSYNGAALTLDAVYNRSNGWYARWDITSWTGIGNGFDAIYARAETNVASAGKELRGGQFYGVSNDVNTGGLKGILAYAYLKGTTAATVGPAYGIHGELTFDAGSATKTITTEAAAGLLKITGGACDAYTKLHGLIVRAGDMDGADRTYGSAIRVVDDTDMAGTISWTDLLTVTNPCGYFLNASAAGVAGVDTTIAGEVVGAINCVVKCKFGDTDFYLYGYATKPTAT